jgi:putative addiction module CopG family antidote
MKVNVEGSLAAFIDREVRTGRYASPRDVVHAALARLQTDRELASEAEASELRTEIDVAIRQADEGDFVEFTAEDIKVAGRSKAGKRRKGA